MACQTPHQGFLPTAWFVFWFALLSKDLAKTKSR
jgi:hypothetical protein